MSLALHYDSDEENDLNRPNNDVFGLSSLPVPKKARTDESSSAVAITAAPHVLAEVSTVFFLLGFDLNTLQGPVASNVSRDTAHGHADECQHSL